MSRYIAGTVILFAVLGACSAAPTASTTGSSASPNTGASGTTSGRPGASSVSSAGSGRVVVGTQSDSTRSATIDGDTVKFSEASGAMGAVSEVAFGNGTWVASTTRGLRYSTDGLNFQDAQGPTLDGLGAVTYADGKWVAAVPSGSDRVTTVATSADGKSWAAKATCKSASTEGFGSIGFDGSRWLAVGYNGSASSTDGTTWTCNTDKAGTMPDRAVWLPEQKTWLGVASGANRSGPTGWVTSDDGATWTASPTQPIPAGDVLRLRYADKTIVAVGAGGAVVCGATPIDLDKQASPATKPLHDAAMVGGNWIAVGEGSTVLRSSGCAQWTSLQTNDSKLTLYAVAGDG